MIGYRFFESNEKIWRIHKGGALPISFPDDKIINHEQAQKIRKKFRLLFLRWDEDFDSGDDASEWWHIIKDIPDELDTLPVKTRYILKKTAKVFEAYPVSAKLIQSKGYKIYLDCLKRYDTGWEIISEHGFQNSIESSPKTTEWWGVFEKETNEMIGFSENFIQDKRCFIVSMWHTTDSLKKCASYHHLYEMEKYYLVENKFKYISDGARNIYHKTNIQNFLVKKFKYRKAYAKLKIVYSPILLILISLLKPFASILFKVKFFERMKFIVALRQQHFCDNS